jgi:hypothetical protein
LVVSAPVAKSGVTAEAVRTQDVEWGATGDAGLFGFCATSNDISGDLLTGAKTGVY